MVAYGLVEPCERADIISPGNRQGHTKHDHEYGQLTMECTTRKTNMDDYYILIPIDQVFTVLKFGRLTVRMFNFA